MKDLVHKTLYIQTNNKQNNAIYLANKHNEATKVFKMFSTTVTIKAIQLKWLLENVTSIKAAGVNID